MPEENEDLRCQGCEKIPYVFIANYIYKNFAWIVDAIPHMSAWEKHEILRDTVDGLICGISRMQMGEFEDTDHLSAFATQDEAIRAKERDAAFAAKIERQEKRERAKRRRAREARKNARK